jgi:hypothetical protein
MLLAQRSEGRYFLPIPLPDGIRRQQNGAPRPCYFWRITVNTCGSISLPLAREQPAGLIGSFGHYPQGYGPRCFDHAGLTLLRRAVTRWGKFIL